MQENTLFINPGLKNWDLGYCLIVEMIFTFFFTIAIFHAKNPKISIYHNGVTGTMSVVIGLYFGIKCSGAYSGAVLNP